MTNRVDDSSVVNFSNPTLEKNQEAQLQKFGKNCSALLDSEEGFSVWKVKYNRLYEMLRARYDIAIANQDYRIMAALQRDMCAYLDHVKLGKLGLNLSACEDTFFDRFLREEFDTRLKNEPNNTDLEGAEYKYCTGELYNEAELALRTKGEKPPTQDITDTSEYYALQVNSNMVVGTEEF